MEWYEEEINRTARNYKKHENDGELSANAWRFNGYGASEPRECTFERIFDAFNDYKTTLHWN
jgi:hypothetical protein